MGWGANIKKRLEQQHQAVNDRILDNVQVLGTLLVVNSPDKPDAPYAKGLFKNSWYVAINEFDPTVGTIPDPKGLASLARFTTVKYSNAFIKRDGFISITNNVSYAFRVEYAGWPAGEGTNGWVWSGNSGPYAPMRNSVIAFKAYAKS